jgi:hypothetical protein
MSLAQSLIGRSVGAGPGTVSDKQLSSWEVEVVLKAPLSFLLVLLFGFKLVGNLKQLLFRSLQKVYFGHYIVDIDLLYRIVIRGRAVAAHCQVEVRLSHLHRAHPG